MHTRETDSDQELARLVAAGDEEAFRFLFFRYKDKLYISLLKICGSSDIAQDCVQEIFIKLWVRRASLTEIDSIEAYLYRMTSNIAFNALRSEKREQDRRKINVAKDIEDESPDSRLRTKEVEEAIQHVVDQLPAQQKKVYELSRKHGLNNDEIAAQMQISAFTVKNHLAKALQSLKSELGDRYDEVTGLVLVLSLFRDL